ncbi:ArsR/SmtB family transcription factor [Desulfovibrio oxyclinae]|uniref:ArsR/SmtB family transcription factor n=1 Tax=Desulfovibrio oxyclinae TaxID=63560 RepID=UPI0003A026E5|nr:metalloregulator ArsR/SmtB family transcription factor [Desulfovibrio oxyclinae]
MEDMGAAGLADAGIEGCAEVFKALGHGARLKMVCMLVEGEQCVCKLQEAVGLDMSTVSRHLSVLKRAGVVSSRRQGNWQYYSLDLDCVGGFVACLAQRMAKRRGA